MTDIRIGVPPAFGSGYTGPPNVGQVHYPGSFCCAELLPGQCLHAIRPEVGQLQRPTGLWGLPPGPSDLPFGAAARGGQAALGCRPVLRTGDTSSPAPNRLQAGGRGPVAGYLAKTYLPAPLSVSGARASPPTSFFRTCRLRLLLVRKNSSAPPPGCRLDRGCAPTSPPSGRLSLRSVLRPYCGLAAPLPPGTARRLHLPCRWLYLHVPTYASMRAARSNL